MRLLLDTNIFLEVILRQEAADDAQAVLSAAGIHDLFASDYTIHSIGLLLFRRGRRALFQGVVGDMIRGAIMPITIPLENLGLVAEAAQKFGLDFDDAYTVAHLNNLEIVSFDRDFDRTDRGRMTPSEVLPPPHPSFSE